MKSLVMKNLNQVSHCLQKEKRLKCRIIRKRSRNKYVSQERIKNRDEPESKFTNSHMSIRNNLKFRIDFDFF